MTAAGAPAPAGAQPAAGTWRFLALALGLTAVLGFPFLAARDLWAPDEPRYAEAAREMLPLSWPPGPTFWYPHVNGHAYPDKPPAYFWAEALLAFGDPLDEGTARLPSVLAALVVVGLTWDLGRRLFGVRAATAAGVVLATTWLFAWMARRVNLDVPLAACVVVSAWSAWCALQAIEEGRRMRRAAAFSALAGLACAMGVMTKGPVALLFVLSALVPIAFRRDVGDAGRRAAALACTATAVLSGAILLVAWLVPAKLIGGYDALAVVKEHVIERATFGRHHVQPPWYYLGTLPVDCLPWTFLAIPTLVAAWRGRAWRSLERCMLLAWALGPLIVLSVIVEKRNSYVVPSLPAWALLVGDWAARLPNGAVALRRCALAIAAVLGAVAIGSIALAVIGGRLPALETYAELPGLRWGLLSVGLTFGGAAALCTVRVARRAGDAVRAIVLVAAGVAVAESSVFAMLPLLDPVKSGRDIGEAIAYDVRDAPLAMVPRTWDAYAFYSGRFLDDLGTREAVTRWLATRPRPAYIVASDEDLGLLPPDGEASPATVTSSQVGHRRMMLLRYDVPSKGVPKP